MNQINSKCNKCNKDIMVNAAEKYKPQAHVCTTCYDEYIAFLRQQHSTPSPYAPILAAGTTAASDDEDAEFEIDPLDLDFYNDYDYDYSAMPGYDKKSCECGAVKANSAWHASYCPVFEEPMGTK